MLEFVPTRRWLWILFFILPMVARAEGLEQLIAEAVSTHPSVQSSLAQARAAQAGINSARWQFFPTPYTNVQSVSAGSNDPSFQGDNYVATVGFSQPLWSGGRLSAGLSKARSGFSASVAAVTQSQQDIALQVVQVYGEWFAAFLKRKAWEESLQSHLRLQSQVSRRVEEGLSAKSDLALAQGRLESTRAEVSTVVAQGTVALSRLSQLVGRKLQSNTLARKHSEPRISQQSINELKNQALLLSPAIKRALAQVLAVKSEIAERKADYWPEVQLRAEHQRGSFTSQNADSENRVFIDLNSRFGAGFSTASNVREARMRLDAALAGVDEQRRAVREQVIADYALMSSFEIRVVALQSALITAHEVSESYRRQFLAGRKTWLDVMNAARDQVGTEVRLADAQASQQTVIWRLVIFTQGISSIDLSSAPLASFGASFKRYTPPSIRQAS